MSKDKRPSLFNASVALNSLIDQGKDGITPQLMDEIRLLKDDIAVNLDKRKYLVKEIDNRLVHAKEMIKDIKEEMKKMEKVRQKVKQSTLDSIKLNPQHVYKDTLGRRVYKSTGQPKLVLDPSIETRSFSVSNCVNERTAAGREVSPYIYRKTFYCLDMDRLKRDIKKGKECSFAKLESKEIVVGLS